MGTIVFSEIKSNFQEFSFYVEGFLISWEVPVYMKIFLYIQVWKLFLLVMLTSGEESVDYR